MTCGNSLRSMETIDGSICYRVLYQNITRESIVPS